MGNGADATCEYRMLQKLERGLDAALGAGERYEPLEDRARSAALM